ncbi:MAG: sensor histidine kinase [Chthoniobacterales bacterium]
MQLIKAFAQQSRTWILAEVALALLVIGFFDFITSYEFRLLPLYAGPIFIAGWFFEYKMGIATALVSAVIWWLANWFNGDPELHSWVRAWEITRHVSFFVLVGWTGAALRAKSDMAAARIALLEHSRQLEHEIVNISESEQRRIGQDLHDGLCQFLAALSCSATSLRGQLEKQHLMEEANHAGELAKLLQSAVIETRDLARSLVPALVSDVGLVVALEALAQSVSRLHGVNCSFALGGNAVGENEIVATHLYRIAQEATSNAINHGKAKNIALSLVADGGQLTLQIIDDGIGIADVPAKTGMGLAVMRYRARLSGGELRIERLEEGGTRIWCMTESNQPERENVAA